MNEIGHKMMNRRKLFSFLGAIPFIDMAGLSKQLTVDGGALRVGQNQRAKYRWVAVNGTDITDTWKECLDAGVFKSFPGFKI